MIRTYSTKDFIAYVSTSGSAAKKYARVIALYAEKEHIGLDAALQKFYHSVTYKLMKDGISDMHCMSDDYLTEELQAEDIQKK